MPILDWYALIKLSSRTLRLFHSLSRIVVPAKLRHTSVNAWKIVPKSHDHHYRFQSHDQNIVVLVDGHSLSRCVVSTWLHYTHFCQRSFYKIFVKFRNSKKNVLKIVLIIVNINKNENKSLISNQFSLKNDSPNPSTHTHTSWRTILRRLKLKTITW